MRMNFDLSQGLERRETYRKVKRSIAWSIETKDYEFEASSASSNSNICRPVEFAQSRGTILYRWQ